MNAAPASSVPYPVLCEGPFFRIFRSAGPEQEGYLLVERHLEGTPWEGRVLSAHMERAEVLGDLCLSPTVAASAAGKPAIAVEPKHHHALSAEKDPLEERLFVAWAPFLIRTLAAAHARGVVHGNLNPDSLLLDRNTLSVRLTGFGGPWVSGFMRSGDSSLVADHLPFIAPEQTGKFEGHEDQKTDIYSLGTVFYTLLAGHPPFTGSDPLRILHQHLAEQPRPLAQIRPDLPAPICRTIDCMLAKDPGSRPGSCRELLVGFGFVGPALAVAGRGMPPRALPPNQEGFIGRGREIAELEGAFAALQERRPALVALTGEAGIGKTRTVKEFRRRLGSDAIFAVGKFEQNLAGSPYAGLRAAIQDLCAQVLSRHGEVVEEWRDAFLRNLGSLCPIIAQFSSDFESLVGPQPVLPELGITETVNRFRFALRRFFLAIAGRSQPVILFLDDLQWADPATLETLEWCIRLEDIGPIAWVLAYREEDRIMQGFHDRLFQSPGPGKFPKSWLRMEGLDLPQLQQMLEPAIGHRRASGDLARAIRAKTMGNPLFTRELMGRIQSEYDGTDAGAQEGRRSNGDTGSMLGTLKRLPATLNVIGILAGKLEKLDAETLRMARVAACIGSRFQESLLASLAGAGRERTTALLEALSSEGIIVPAQAQAQDSDLPGSARREWAFAHDKVQQAAYEGMDVESRASFHWRIGKAMLEGGDAPLTAAVDHLNLGHGNLRDPRERLRLATLNLAAARQSKAAVAFDSAREYARAGLGHLPDAGWKENHDLALDLHLVLAECEYLTKDFASAESICRAILAHVGSDAERKRVRLTQLLMLSHLQKYDEAIGIGLEALSQFGIRLRRKPSMPRVLLALASVKLKERRIDLEKLEDLTGLVPDRVRDSMDLLIALWGPAFWLDQALNACVTLAMVDLCFRYGNTEHSAIAYACYGVLNCVAFKQHAKGKMLGDISIRMAKKRRDPFLQSRVRFIHHTFFEAFDSTAKEVCTRYEETFKYCVENGEHVFAGCCSDGIACVGPLSSYSLEDLEYICLDFHRRAAEIGNRGSQFLIEVTKAWIANIRDYDSGSRFELPPDPIEHEAYSGVYHMLKMQLDFLGGEYKQVLTSAGFLRKNQVVLSNPLHIAFYQLFVGLTFSQLHGTAVRPGEREASRKLDACLRAIRKLASISPQRFRPFQECLAAERHRIAGRHRQAAEMYDRALESARLGDYSFLEALVAELAGRHYLKQGRKRCADAYLEESRSVYRRWGATAQEARLERNYGLPSGQSQADSFASRGQDMKTLAKAAEIISTSTDSVAIAYNLLTLSMEYAGAESGALLLNMGAGWKVEAYRHREPDGSPPSCSLEEADFLPKSFIQYCIRARTSQAVSRPCEEHRWEKDPYFSRARPGSCLVVPISNQGEVIGCFYLENGVLPNLFGPDQIRLVQMIAYQSVIALNLTAYHNVQLESLRAQINPHFIFNTFNSLASMVKPGTEIESALLMLSDLFRYILDSSGHKMHLLSDEVKMLGAYLELEKLRYDSRLTYSIITHGNLGRVPIPGMILQPLVENAIKHGIAPKEDGGTVTVTIDVGDTRCSIRIRDDGIGWDAGRKSTGSGRGLSNVRQRLKLAYGEGYRLGFVSDSGVTVHLEIPVTANA